MSHALLSPSSSSRWMACTPSARLEEQFPDKTSSYAEEGTLAHEICEILLLNTHGMLSDAKFKTQFAKLKKHEFFSDSMMEYCQDYVDYVSMQITPGKSHLFVEYKLDMTKYIPEGFGTADAIVIADGVLRFTDLKYGKGVPVYAPNNSQLKIYALGALNDFGHIFDVDTVEMTIFQPRLDNTSTWTISAKDLIEWAETELKEKAELAFKGEGEFQVGNHCGFCKAKAKCRALHDHNVGLAKGVFPDPDQMSDEELLKVLEGKKLFTAWLDAVTDHLLESAINGKEYEGYKLVEGRSNRQYGDPETVEKKLIAKGIENIYTDPKLVGITELTKRIGKAKFSELVEPELIKPPGKPTLVPAADERPALTNAKDVFNDEMGKKRPHGK